jgi:DNA-directed RNA polymerase subunit RPC12/RpoP
MIEFMQVAFRCPRCEQTARGEVADGTSVLSCGHCGGRLGVPDEAFAGGGLKYCLACHSPDLFVRKDFPQRLGVCLVVLGFLLSAVAWNYYRIGWAFGILFVTAGIDVLLYLLVGEALVCYRCHAHYRGAAPDDRQGHFDLETHERYRQLAARQAAAKASKDSAL